MNHPLTGVSGFVQSRFSTLESMQPYDSLSAGDEICHFDSDAFCLFASIFS